MNAHARIDIARELLTQCQTRLGLTGVSEEEHVYHLLLCVSLYVQEQGLRMGQIVVASCPKPKRQLTFRYS